MNKITIITTVGCEACEIAKNNVDIAIAQSTPKIEVEVKDWHEFKKDFIHSNKIKDFPTVLYTIDNKLVNKAVGSYPSAVYLRWIDMYFKK